MYSKTLSNKSRFAFTKSSLSSHLNVNEIGELVKSDGSVIPSSRFEDLIQHAVRDRRRKFIPVGWDYFLELLRTYNVPKSVLNRETLDELDGVSNVKPAIKNKPSKLPYPKIWPTKPRGRSPFKKRHVKQSPDTETRLNSMRPKRNRTSTKRYMMLSKY